MKRTNKISRPRRGHADTKRGAVLLIAILVSSVALAVGFGVYNRTYKELLFASYWKQTQIAFSAADAGLECALYWELHPAQATCFNTTIPLATWTPGELTAPGGFELNVPGGGCVNIKIEWNTALSATTTEARGYNTCDTTSPRRVERGLGFSL